MFLFGHRIRLRARAGVLLLGVLSVAYGRGAGIMISLHMFVFFSVVMKTACAGGCCKREHQLEK